MTETTSKDLHTQLALALRHGRPIQPNTHRHGIAHLVIPVGCSDWYTPDSGCMVGRESLVVGMTLSGGQGNAPGQSTGVL
jgi:hypothetical protein